MAEYTVERVLGDDRRGTVYLAQHPAGRFVLREVRAPADLAPGEREVRRRRLEEAVQKLSGVSHPHLVTPTELVEGTMLASPYVVGPTLSTVLRWHREPLTRDQILRWGIQACAIARWLLEENPGPPAAQFFDAEHLIVDENDQLVLANLGLSALLTRHADEARDSERLLLERFRLVTGFMVSQLEDAGEMPPDLAIVLSRRYNSLEETEQKLREAYSSPREPGETLELVQAEEFQLPTLVDDRISLARAFLSQRPALIAAQVLVMSLLGWLLWETVLKPPPPRDFDAVYVATESGIACLRVSDFSVFRWLNTPEPVEVLLVPGNRLLAGYENSRRLSVWQATTDKPAPGVLAEAEPSRGVALPGRAILFYRALPAASLVERGERGYQLAASLPLGRNAMGTTTEEPARLYAASPATSQLYVYDLVTRESLGVAPAHAVVDLAIDPAGGRLFVATGPGLETRSLADLSLRSLERWEVDPFRILFERTTGRLWCLTRKGELVAVGSPERIELGSAPGGATLAGTQAWVSLPQTGEVAVVDLVNPSILARIALGSRPGPIVFAPAP